MNEFLKLIIQSADVIRKKNFDKKTGVESPSDYVELTSFGFSTTCKAHPSIVTGGYTSLTVFCKAFQSISVYEEKSNIQTTFKIVHIPEQLPIVQKKV